MTACRFLTLLNGLPAEQLNIAKVRPKPCSEEYSNPLDFMLRIFVYGNESMAWTLPDVKALVRASGSGMMFQTIFAALAGRGPL